LVFVQNDDVGGVICVGLVFCTVSTFNFQLEGFAFLSTNRKENLIAIFVFFISIWSSPF
jgi:hypothetical protein